MEISHYDGPREHLAPLFAEADDSESEIASYIALGEILVARDDGNIVGHVQVVATSESSTFEIIPASPAMKLMTPGGIPAASYSFISW